jgi:hypothetical protein
MNKEGSSENTEITEIVEYNNQERKDRRGFPGPGPGSDPEWIKQDASYWSSD